MKLTIQSSSDVKTYGNKEKWSYTCTLRTYSQNQLKKKDANDRLCGLVVRVPGCRSRGPEYDSRHYQIFWEVVGLERGPLSLVSTIEELLERKSSSSGLESREYGRRDPSRWPRGTLYPQKLKLTSPTSGGRSVGILRSRRQATEFSFSFVQLRTSWLWECCTGMYDAPISYRGGPRFKSSWLELSSLRSHDFSLVVTGKFCDSASNLGTATTFCFIFGSFSVVLSFYAMYWNN
jgi:hypothetical protein